jgi:hypothetical protein
VTETEWELARFEATSDDMRPPAAICHAGVVFEFADGVSPIVAWAFIGILAKPSNTVEASATNPAALIRSLRFARFTYLTLTNS